MEEKKLQEQETTESLQDFNWDDSEDFFGIPSKEEEVDIKIESKTEEVEDEGIEEEVVEDKKNIEKKKEDKSETKEKVEEDFFDKEEDSPESGDDSNFYTTLATEMKEKGIFQNLELEEGEEIDEKRFFELQDAEIEARVEETFEAFGENMDEDGKAFLRFKQNGGNTQDFFKVYNSQNSFLLEDIDTRDEGDQDIIIKHYLRTVDSVEEDEIIDKIDWLGENGKKKAYAERYLKKLKETEEENKKNLALQVERASIQREENTKKFNAELQSELSKIDSVGSFSFNKVDKKDLVEYITKPSVKIGKNKFITPFQAELGEIFRAEGDKKQNLLLLAKLVKTNFDVKDLLESAKTKVVKEAKSKLQAAKEGVRASSTKNFRGKGISDYF